MTLDLLQTKLKKIKKRGFIVTHRAHNTGIGKTLEDLLEIDENNLSTPDAGKIEIKAQRKNSKAMITLLTKSPQPAGVNRKLFEEYKYKGEEGEYNLHSTIYYSSTNSQGFELDFDKEGRLFLQNPQRIKAYWPPSIYDKIIKSKTNKLLLVLASTKGKQGTNNEKFHYEKAYLLEGLTQKSIKNAIKKDKIRVDLRIGVYRSGERKGEYHDHGTAFRISKKDIYDLYENKREFL